MVAVAGGEDGAHKVSADLHRGLDDAGHSPDPDADAYRVGEAVRGTDHKDPSETPETTASATRTLAPNSPHLARLPATSGHPGKA
ncbi:hypothetical protein ABZ929_10205 [Streptomyces physcomitrii]|uniref:hypothetical protein n=1 Tax=Streptomyces physcomitrii TaxID=2724184 RepID=UPI0033F7BF66